MQMRRSVLDASELVAIQHVARNADRKQLADARAEDGLRNHTRVGTGNHNGIGVLTVLGGFQPCGGGYDPRRFPGEVAPVARQKAVEKQMSHAVLSFLAVLCRKAFIRSLYHQGP